MSHLYFVRASVLELLHHGIEARAAATAGQGHGVNVEFHRYHAAAVVVPHSPKLISLPPMMSACLPPLLRFFFMRAL